MNKKLICGASIASLVMSFGTLTYVICRTEPVTWDLMAILVGILSLLVTVLIGWQLFQVFNIKEVEERIKSDIDAYLIHAGEALLLMYYNSLITYKENKDHPNFIITKIQYLIAAVSINRLDLANRHANEVISMYPNGIKVSTMTNYNKIRDFFNKSRGLDKLERYKELEDIILNKITTDE